MSDTPKKFALGDRDFSVPVFTFDQLVDLAEKFDKASVPLGRGGLAGMRDVIGYVVAEQIGADEMKALRTDALQILNAFNVIADVAGFDAVGEALKQAAKS